MDYGDKIAFENNNFKNREHVMGEFVGVAVANENKERRKYNNRYTKSSLLKGVVID